MRGSEFHENEPQSLHRLIQISQLHISESFPHPSQPEPQVPILCPPLFLPAQNRRSNVKATRGVCCIQSNPHLTEKGALRPRVAEQRLKSGDGSFHTAPPSPVLLDSKHKGSGYRAISKFPRFQNSPDRAKGRREQRSG